MTGRTRLKVPLNRVEGDLEVRVEMDDGVVADAWAAGIMFRGIETALEGRGRLDGLVITPRICGICSVAQLLAAAIALDDIAGASPPDGAVRVRNLALAAETVQSDLRHAILTFAADFASPAYADHPWHAEAVARYAPFEGTSASGAIGASLKMVEVLGILGGQWPHSSFITPGGIMSRPTASELNFARDRLRMFRTAYERQVLGCDIGRWREVRSAGDLDAWLEESDAHRAGDLGFLIRAGREAGLDAMGRGPDAFLSVGAGSCAATGTRIDGVAAEFDDEAISEHVWHSRYEASEPRHPSRGVTVPEIDAPGGYSLAKAPRYGGRPMETGPLAERLVEGHPLYRDLVAVHGTTALVRQLARITRPAELVVAMERWLGATSETDSFYSPPGPIPDGDGVGHVAATRGLLGHWVSIRNGAIDRYQIITPTGWNASPRDDAGIRGPMEDALIGTTVRDPEHPVELGHVVRSFDPCLVCTVHTLIRRPA